MKEGQTAAQKLASQQSRDILEKYGIDPFFDQENLVWAPNWGHSDQYAADVLAALKEADEVGTREAVVAALQKLAKDYNKGRWRPK